MHPFRHESAATKSRARRIAVVMAGVAVCAASPALGAENGGFDLSTALAADAPEWQWGDLEFRLGGDAGGALFRAHEDDGPLSPDGYDDTAVSGIATTNLRIQRIFDNGMIVGARGYVLLYHDALSSDIYNNDTIQKLYAYVQTGFGRIEAGEADGAGYQIGLTGPEAVPLVNLEGAGISLFRDPTTGGDFSSLFTHVTAVQSSSNYAKFSYVSPRLFGVQLGASFTPHAVRAPVPFAGNPPNTENGQDGIWEIAGSYSDYISDVAVGISAAYAHGSLRNRSAGFSDLTDWAIGSQFAYTLSDVKLSAGVDYRQTNAYLLDITQALAGGGTHLVHVSATAEWGPWIFGGEYVFADATGPVDYGIAGYEAALGYRVNDNLQVSAGWQWQNWRRHTGVFYNGAPGIDMNAGFLTVNYAL